MQLVLDMSQNVVNKTAAYFIAKDIDMILRDFNPLYQYFGNIFPNKISSEKSEDLKSLFFDSLAKISEKPIANPCFLANSSEIVSYGTTDIKKFYIDPLYVCYSDLSPNDIVLIHDISPIVYPQWHNEAVCKSYDFAFNKILETKPHLIAVSQYTADCMYANFGYAIGDIHIAHLYVPRHLEACASQVDPLFSVKPYFLFTGSLEFRKNLFGAVEAFRCSRLYEEGYQLLLVGGKGHGTEAILKVVNEVPGVKWCGYLSNEELASYYAGATGFLYPSYLEGFGVPLLEALYFGVPCIATTNGASPEVGGELVAYAEPDDHVAIADWMRQITLLSPEVRGSFASRARQRVCDHFSFEAFASSIRAQVREA